MHWYTCTCIWTMEASELGVSITTKRCTSHFLSNLFFFYKRSLFISPEPKTQVSFWSLVVRVSVDLWTFQIIFFLSRITWPIPTRFVTTHPWVKGIQIYSNEGPCPFARRDNNEIAKVHKRNQKKKYDGPISSYYLIQ